MSTPYNPYDQQDSSNNPYGSAPDNGNASTPAGGYDQQSYGQQQPYAQQPYSQPYSDQPYGAYGQQPYVQPVVGQKSKIVAGILGILLGSLGVHNFYLGFTGKAVVQLLITVVSLGMLSFISGIWGLVEGILILVSKPGTPQHRDSRGFELQD